MSSRQLSAIFAHERDLLAVVRELRANRLPIHDVFTPYPVHGIETALGLRDTRIGWVCAVFGLSGAALALLFQEWTSVVSWSLNVGGKPYDSWPAFVPVVFEVGVLCGGIASVLALFYLCGLYPGKEASQPSPRITDDRFAVIVDASVADFDMDRAREIIGKHGGLQITESLGTTQPRGQAS